MNGLGEDATLGLQLFRSGFRPAKKTYAPHSAAVVILASVLFGAIIPRAGIVTYIVIAAVVLGVMAAMFSGHLASVLVLWVAIEGLAYPFVRYPLDHNVITFDRVVIVALGGALLLTPPARTVRESSTLVKAFGLFAIVYGVRAFLTEPLPPPPNYAVVSAFQIVTHWLDGVALPFIVFLVAARTMTRSNWEKVAKALAFLGVSVAVFGLLEWRLGFELATISGYSPFVDTYAGVVRVGGPYPDPSAYGGVMVVCLAATVYWMQAQKAYVLGGAAVLVELMGLVPSFTKTVWGAGFATLVIALGLSRRAPSRTVLVSVYLATMLVIIYTFVQSSPVVAQRVTSAGSYENFIARLGGYVQGVLIFEHWPWFGAGIHQFIAAQQLVAPVSVAGVRAGYSAHNTFVSVLAESGLVGFLALMFLVYATVRVVRACRRRGKTDEEVLFGASVLAATVGYLLLSLTLAEIYYPPSTTFLALVLGAAAARLTPGPASAMTAEAAQEVTVPVQRKDRTQGFAELDH